MFKAICLSCILFLSHTGWAALSSDDALTELLAGNKRFYSGQSNHTQWNKEARVEKSGPQKPFAVILSCSDSRVPTEIIFDQGLGDIFVVRVAGNVVGDTEMASIEYGVSQLNAPLILVLGHQECGAIKAVLTVKESDAGLRGIYPMISSAIRDCTQKEGNALKNAIYCNVKGSIKRLESCSALTSFLKQKTLKIVGGYYDFSTGKVTLIPQGSPQEK